MRPEIRALLVEAVRTGVGLWVEDGRVRVRFQCGERPELRERLRAVRDELRRVLAEPPEGHDDPRWAVRVLASVDRWRAWLVACQAQHGHGGPPGDAAGYAVYRALVGTWAPGIPTTEVTA